MLRAAVARGDMDEAKRLWSDDLEDGAAWRRYRASQPATDDLSAGDAERLVGDLLAVHAVALAAGHEQQSLDAAMEAIEIRQRRVDPTPQDRADLAESKVAASRSLEALGRLDERVAMLEQAVASYRDLGEATKGPLFVALGLLVSTLLIAGRQARALEIAEEAVEVCHARDDGGPRGSWSPSADELMMLGQLLRLLGQAERASSTVYEVVELRRRLAEAEPELHMPALVETLCTLSQQLLEQGKREEALAAAEEAVTLCRANLQVLPGVELAHAVRTRALVLAALGRNEQALATSREAVELYRASTTSPNTSLAEALDELGLRLSSFRRFSEAVAATEEAVGILRELLARPSNDRAPITLLLALTLRNLGDHQAAVGQHEQALTSTQQAIDLLRGDGSHLPGELAIAFDKLGDHYAELERTGEAIAAKEKAAEGFRAMLQSTPAVRSRLASTLDDLATLRNRVGDKNETRSLTKAALQLRMTLTEEERHASSAAPSRPHLSRTELLRIIRPFTRARARAIYWSVIAAGVALAITALFLSSWGLRILAVLLSATTILLSIRKLQQIPIMEIQRAIELYEIRNDAVEQRKRQMQAHGLPADRIEEKLAPEEGHSRILLARDLLQADEDLARIAHRRDPEPDHPPDS